MLGKKELSETLGLSCVEKYFAAWLCKFTDVAKLYGASFVSMAQVLARLIKITAICLACKTSPKNTEL